MKKKLLALVICVALVAALTIGLAACNNGGNDNNGIIFDNLFPIPTVNLTDEGKETAKTIKIGVLHINPVTSRNGYTYAHEQGILAMQKAIGLQDSQIIYKDSLDDKDSTEVNNAVNELIAAGCNVIIGTSFNYQDQMSPIAKQHPNVYFLHGTGYMHESDNYKTYFGRIYQARYLSGIVAGLKAQQGANLGYVSAMGNSNAECTSGINAFALGVQAVNPTAKVYVENLNKWYDPEKETSYAETLLGAPYNCEVIAQHCDTENPPLAANKVGKWSVGYNSDMSKTAAGSSVLTSVVWNWGVYYAEAIEKICNGAWDTLDSDWYGGYIDGLFDITTPSDQCAPNTQKYIDAVKALFNNTEETWDVFKGKLTFSTDADGNVTITAKDGAIFKQDGATSIGNVDDTVIKGTMDFYVQGVYPLFTLE